MLRNMSGDGITPSVNGNYTTSTTTSASAAAIGNDGATETGSEFVQPVAERMPADYKPIRDLFPKPTVTLPGGSQTISDAGREFGKLFAATKQFYMRGGAVVYIQGDKQGQLELAELKPKRLASDFESVALLERIDSKGNAVPDTCNAPTAELIFESEAFREQLPTIQMVSQCPVLIERDGQLVEVSGFDAESGIYAEGSGVEKVELAAAVELLNDMLSEFHFTTVNDRSRALAALITPALVMGGLLPGRAAMDLAEANESQSGKGFRLKLTAAIYNDAVTAIAQPNGKKGVGTIEEAFDSALIKGRNFISLDNVKGRIDSPKLESCLTEDVYYARGSYTKNVEIDPRRTYVMMTSNGADLTKDLANRCSAVKITKREGYEYRTWKIGDNDSANILAKVRAEQPRYLGAVFAVIREWHAQGKQRTKELRHDFKDWVQCLDWIVQNIFGAKPMMDGHTETQERMTNPVLNWLRELLMILERQGVCGEWVRCFDILRQIEDEDIEIPGLRQGGDIERDQTQILQQMGKRLKKCFGDPETVTRQIDNLIIDRREYTALNGKTAYEYLISRAGETPADVPF
jgi:hypothetical protein